jgi:hypothetical protein
MVRNSWLGRAVFESLQKASRPLLEAGHLKLGIQRIVTARGIRVTFFIAGLRSQPWIRQSSQFQALGCDEMKNGESIVGRGLIVLVVTHHPAARIRRQDLGRQKVLARKRALPRPARANQDDKRELGDGDVHRLRYFLGAKSLNTTLVSVPFSTEMKYRNEFSVHN